MNLHIRPFTGSDADYAAVVGVHNAVYPEQFETVDDWKRWDSTRPAHCYMDRWMAEEGGRCVGFAHAVQFPGMYHPQKYFVDVRVTPAARRRGVGPRLYDAVVGRLEQPIALRSEVREDFGDSLAFLAARGYVEEMRTWESRLDLAGFDPAPFAAWAAKAAAHGVQITTFAAHVGDSRARRHELYEAAVELLRDVPWPDTFTPLTFEQWEQNNLDDPHMLPEGYFLALHGGQIAGLSQLWRTSMDDVLYTGLTATRRDFRRMGIAMALKLRALAYAKTIGMREVRTGNESNNRAMLSINEALGFVKQPAWITLVNHLRDA